MTNSPSTKTALSNVYNQKFYDSQVADSLQSAQIYLGHLFALYKPKSVADLGCGRGAWLKACCELGAENAFGYDGPWNSQTQMIDDRIKFTAVDLDLPVTSPQRVDLAISLEVAEHLKPENSLKFAESLANLSDVILFGAAVSGQGGTNHINEQYQSYWGKFFCDLGYDVFDLFRPLFWHEHRVEAWYRQNTFLYVKKGHALSEILQGKGLRKLINIQFMDCVHPEVWEMKLEEISRIHRLHANTGFLQHIKELVPSFVRGLKTRLQK